MVFMAYPQSFSKVTRSGSRFLSSNQTSFNTPRDAVPWPSPSWTKYSPACMQDVSPFYNDHLMGNNETNKACLCCRCSVPSPLETATTMSTQGILRERKCQDWINDSMTDKSRIRNAISTILVTSEDGFGYTSFKAVGYEFNTIHLSQLVTRVCLALSPRNCSCTLECWNERVQAGDQYRLGRL